MNLLLDEFVVMPNHFHGIISIGENHYNGRDAMPGVSMPGVSTKARKNHSGFAWQERYHDHIIRNHESLIMIQEYIINNPVNDRRDAMHGVSFPPCVLCQYHALTHKTETPCMASLPSFMKTLSLINFLSRNFTFYQIW